MDPSRLVLWGVSRGSEAALLTAADRPDLIDGVIADSPSSVSNPAVGPGGVGYPNESAWTRAGQPVPIPTVNDRRNPAPADAPGSIIPVERIRGPILTACGGADMVWVSCAYSQAIARRADTRPGVAPVTTLAYPAAGRSFLWVGRQPVVNGDAPVPRSEAPPPATPRPPTTPTPN